MAIKVIVDNSGSSNISVTVSRAGSPGLPGRTAYQYAVEAGYTGTEEQFAEDQANFASNATQVREDRDTTEGYKNESLGYKNDAEDARDDAEEAKTIAENASNIAVSAKNDAVSAKNDTEDAKIAAETAQGIAEGARDTAVSASNTAVSAKNDAVEAKGDAENAKTAAESARDTAVSAKNDAVSAKNDAESAKDTAVLAANTAVQAKDDALLAQSAAESARDTAVGARNEAVDARNEAVPAANAATSAKNDAEDARDIAVQAKDDAEDASSAAIQAKGDAELAAQSAEEDRDEAEGYRDESEQFRDEAYYFAYLTGLGSPLWYGVQWDITVASTGLTRIGNLDMHRELPIQNNRFGCALKDDGVINYKLHPNNWAYKSNGEPSLRDGTDGQIGVFQEQYFARFETEGNIRRIKVSPFALPGYKEIPTYYRGAYEAAVHRPTNKLASVANNTADYRGGNNNDTWDGDDRSLLGVPATNISRTNFQAYARNRGVGWEMEPWWIYLSEWWLYLIEYANRNCQLPFTPSLTVEGFRQGGLGNGVTNLAGASWSSWKNSNPFIPCGYTDDIGVFSGEKSFEVPAGYGSALTTYVPRWRGIENPFGHIWKVVNGINILVQSDDAGGKSYAYRSDNPADWSDSSNVDYRLIGEVARASEYMTDVIFGDGGDLLPRETGGSSSTFWADRTYANVPASGESINRLTVGGISNNGVGAGFGCLGYSSTPGNSSTNIGSRLCFLPEHPLLI